MHSPPAMECCSNKIITQHFWHLTKDSEKREEKRGEKGKIPPWFRLQVRVIILDMMAGSFSSKLNQIARRHTRNFPHSRHVTWYVGAEILKSRHMALKKLSRSLCDLFYNASLLPPESQQLNQETLLLFVSCNEQCEQIVTISHLW